MIKSLAKLSKVGKSVPRIARLSSHCLPMAPRSFSTELEVQNPTRGEQYQVRENIPRGKNRQPYDLKVGDLIDGTWRVEKIDEIPFFQMTAYQSTHEVTGAKHIHLDCQDMDNVFAVLFRTPPDDNTGKPHILEHLATCGSMKYPVRDPFMQMLKRSLNTYMNAWTGSDFTMYPFSTQNPQDFRNLLSVYCDMAFFPTLNYFDFRQEGHRLEFSTWNDPESQLEIKGIVFNEMKGAMNDPEEAFLQHINHNLFKQSQYKFNSGGDPKFIPELEYEELVDFHSKYYHPSNCTFLTYGDLDFTDHLAFINREVLKDFTERKEVSSELLLDQPDPQHSTHQASVDFMPDMMSAPETQGKMGITYVCQEMCQDPYEAFKLQILSHLLFEGPNSLFFQGLIETGAAPNYCPGYGYDYTTRQSTFTVGVQGVETKDFAKLERQISELLTKAAKEGFEKKLFETVLHQLEFAAKKTKSQIGLGYVAHLVPFCLHGGDPLHFFKIDEYSKRVRAEFDQGQLFENLIRKYLLDNNHRLRLYMRPDTKEGEKQDASERKKLEALQKSLTEEEKKSIVAEAYNLTQYQEKP